MTDEERTAFVASLRKQPDLDAVPALSPPPPHRSTVWRREQRVQALSQGPLTGAPHEQPADPPGGAIDPAPTGGDVAKPYARRALTSSRRALVRQNAQAEPEPVPTEQRPRCRAECANVPRPCPWVGCRFNLYLDVKPGGSLVYNFPGIDVDELTTSNCALDVADEGGVTLDAVGALMNFTRENARLLETRALNALAMAKELG